MKEINLPVEMSAERRQVVSEQHLRLSVTRLRHRVHSTKERLVIMTKWIKEWSQTLDQAIARLDRSMRESARVTEAMDSGDVRAMERLADELAEELSMDNRTFRDMPPTADGPNRLPRSSRDYLRMTEVVASGDVSEMEKLAGEFSEALKERTKNSSRSKENFCNT